MMRTLSKLLILLAMLLSATACPAADPDPLAEASSALQILDYLAVDYAGAVQNGQVVDAAEFEEQREFSVRLVQLVSALPAVPGKAPLQSAARELSAAIAAHAPAADIRSDSGKLSSAIISAYGVSVIPRQPPSLDHGADLYAQHCAACHGMTGHGDGPLAAQLDPKPVDFHDRERQSQRSIYGLFNTITLGVEGTAMTGFRQLSERDRWTLAFYVSDWFATDAERRQGQAMGDAARKLIPNLTRLTRATPAEMRAQHGSEGLAALTWLRRHPGDLAPVNAADPIEISRRQLAASFDAYHAGHQQQAYELAVAAYLDGFELAEASLRPTSPELVTTTETAMLAYRGAVKSGAPVSEVDLARARADSLLADAQSRLSASALSPGMGFTSALIILVREGLEAILVLAAVAAFLVKTGRRDAMRYLHSGWIAALALGVLTWIAAKFLITFSGAGRELTEGVTALFATGMLLWVGCWLHDYAHAARWQRFIRDHVQDSLTRGTMWSLATIAFIAVYREMLETILFYEALWLQAGNDAARSAIIGGLVCAVFALAGLAWIILRASMRLPLRLFFGANTVLLFVLAVVFAGKGIAALQEAGKVNISPLPIPTIDSLGIYPTVQSTALQGIIIALALGYLGWRRWQASRPAS